MKISIIIPAFNEEKVLGQSLNEIKDAAVVFAARDWATEVIVCDNNSSDRTTEIAKAAGAQVVFEPVNQIARARNTGARAAKGEWLIFIDADSHPSRALLDEVGATMVTGRVIGGGATVRMAGVSPVVAMICAGWNRLSRFKRWAAGSFLFCEAAAFREVGGFNEEYYVSEEIDLSRRLKSLASRSRKRFVILHKNSIVTSSRKMQLYTPREHLAFLARTVLGGGRTLRNRAACPIWYDGRR